MLRSAPSSALLLVVALVAPAVAVGSLVGPGDADHGLASPLARAAGVDADAPAPRDADFVELVRRADARFGVERPAIAYAVLDELDADTADVVADLLAALLRGADERDAAFADVTDAELRALVDDEGSEAALAVAQRVDADRLRRAAVTVAAAVDAARPTLERIAATRAAVEPTPVGGPLAPPLVDLFPVLGVDPLGIANVYPHDYFLSVDLGGDDVYDNNAGGSIIVRGFIVGDPDTFGPRVGPFTIGGQFEDSQEAYSATLAVDVAGDDTYGVYRAPSTVGGSRDRLCTSDLLVRRVVVQGSGSGGFGILADFSGNDRYRGKTLAQGHGHIAGVGLLFDAAGDDAYTAIRAAQGSAIVQGVGVLVDASGHDRYSMLSPVGGIWNVDRGRCDDTERLALGAAVAQGVGVFVDVTGDDAYDVDAQALGHGDGLGYAAFVDAAGADDYGGYPGRGNGVTVRDASASRVAVFVDAA